MTGAELIAALDLPPGAQVDRRVPKKLLLEHGAPTAADKRAINNGVETLSWIAVLKPDTIAVPDYRDETREYLEIAVLSLVLRGEAKTGRLLELVHRAVPYPVLLVMEGDPPGLSLAHKRWSQLETGKVVLEGDVLAMTWDDDRDAAHESALRASLRLADRPQASLHALYQGWMEAVLALLAASRTGTFALSDTLERSMARRAGLQECTRLEAEVARLRAAAAKEKRLPRQVELNLEIKRLEAALVATSATL